MNQTAKSKKKSPGREMNAPGKPRPADSGKSGFLQKYTAELLLAVVILITAAVYFPALHHRFTNWDDLDYVTENPYIREFSTENINHIFTKPIALNYHPLTILSLALNFRISGTEPWSYFLVNILLHLLNILLTYRLVLLLLRGNKPAALFVAAVFAVHPMHVESVAWISERKDVLYAFFFLSSMILWSRYVFQRRWYLYLFSFLLFILSGLSKPSAVVLPLVLLLADHLLERKFTFRVFIEKIPFFAISAWIGLATVDAQVGKAIVDIRNYNFLQQFLFASYGFFIYIFKLIIPFGQSALHPVPVFNTSFDMPWIYFASPFFVLVILILTGYSLKFTRVVFFGLAFYFLNIVLTLQFMQVGSAVIAERYTYVSYTGLLIGLYWLLNRRAGSGRMQARYLYLAMALFFSMMAYLSMRRVAVWKDSGTLWSDVIARYPESHTAYNNRGYFLVQEKKYDQALPDFSRSLELVPNYVEALNNRGSLYRLLEKPREAIGDYSRALALDSNHIKALTGRGNAYAALGLPDSALTDYNMAYRLNPRLSMSLADRGSVLFRLGRYEEAIIDCNMKIDAHAEKRDTYLNRAVAYSSLGQWEKAIPDYSFVLDSVKDNPSIYEWRGVAYRNTGSLQQAIDDFTRGIGLDPSKASLYLNRAMAFRDLGMKQQADEDMRKANQLGAGTQPPSGTPDGNQ